MRESRAVHRPSLPSTTLQTIPCVWSCGSSSREAGWTKHATASPAGTCPSRPPNPRRARPPSSSRNEKAALTASRCASASAARNGSSASAQGSETDLGAESVKSQPGVWSVATRSNSRPPSGCSPFARARNAAGSTAPTRPSDAAAFPSQQPPAARPAAEATELDVAQVAQEHEARVGEAIRELGLTRERRGKLLLALCP